MIRGLLGAAAGVIGATVSDPEVGFPAWVDLTGVVAGFGLGLLASTGSATSLVVFARTRHFAFLRTAQLFLILVAPALGTVSVAFANPAR